MVKAVCCVFTHYLYSFLTTIVPNIFFNKDGQKTLFGVDFENDGYYWSETLCQKDSDGDGLTNGDELGDPCCYFKVGEFPRRTNLSELSDPNDASSINKFVSATAEARVFSFTASSTYFSVKLQWQNPSNYTVCWYQLLIDGGEDIGFRTIHYLDWNELEYTRFNLKGNSTYNFLLQANSLKMGEMTPIAITTQLDPLHQGVGDQCNYENVRNWTEVFPVNSNYEKLLINSSLTVRLDISPPAIGSLTILGCLIFPDEQLELSLSAEKIAIAGMLQIGTEEKPYVNKATITLTGERSEESLIGLGNKILSVSSGGVLSFHGKPHPKTWTRLDQTAKLGTNTIHVEHDVSSWNIGDQIVIASTDYDPHQAETAHIVSIDSTGRSITIDKNLTYMHYGETEEYIGRGGRKWRLSERAEVGLLTRNIVVQGDESSDASFFGGHTIFTSTSKRIMIDSVEYRRMGQRNILGKYPVHFHLFNDASTSYVRRAAIHHTYQRAITLHGVHKLRVTGVVAYHNYGHAFFFGMY
jgi:hypothetical protein